MAPTPTGLKLANGTVVPTDSITRSGTGTTATYYYTNPAGQTVTESNGVLGTTPVTLPANTVTTVPQPAAAAAPASVAASAATPAQNTVANVSSQVQNVSASAQTISANAKTLSGGTVNATPTTLQIQSMRGPTVNDDGTLGATPPETLAYAQPPAYMNETVLAPTATPNVLAIVPYTSAAVAAAAQTTYPNAVVQSGGSALNASSGTAATGQNSTTATNATTASTVDSASGIDANTLLSNLISALGVGANAGSANSGYGVGASDTSLPSPTAADVAALQPTATTTTSSGPSIAIVLGLLAVVGLGVYLYFKYRKGH